MADYFVDYNGNITKNKKKKKQPTYIVSTDGTITKNKISPQSSEVNDIAPVKTDEDQKWYQGWLKKSEGNFGQTVKASGVDLAEDATTGVVGSGEKLLDSLMAFAPAMNNLNKINSGQMLDAEDWKEHDKQKKVSEEFIKKDLYDEAEVAKKIITTPFEKRTGIDVESMSVFDKKADSLAQSGGQMGVTALVSLANPMLGTAMLGGTSFGSEMENALNKGATYDEAMLSATITAGAEMLTEKISGGISLGGKTLDDLIPVDKLAQGISNKVVRNLINIGVDATGEGFEEIVSGVLSAVGQKMTYMEEKELKELFSSEEALESFLGGAILGGISSTGKTTIDTVKGKDSLSGLSKNEKAVFDKVYNDAIAKKESDGKKLTQKEKNKIYDDTLEKLEKGRIDTDTIGSMFAKDSYKKYMESVEKEKADLEAPTAKLEELNNKLKSLEDAPNTVGNSKQYDEIKRQIEETEKQIEEIKNNSGRFQLQGKMDSEAFELLKGTKLAESYNEKARKRQHFEADLTKYDSKQQAVIQEAIDSGILNNTNQTHEFVDWLARVSADKGVSFDFMNNQRLKESGFALEGKTVNGFRKGNNITVNIQSGNELRTVVGHEITHVLEGSPEFYDALASSVKTFAEAKGIYESMYNTSFENYKNVYKDMTEEEYKKAIEKEVTADLVGEYIFSDADFVRRLSTKNRNVFEKVYDEIKYFLKTVTAGSDAEKQLLKAKKIFEEVYRESNVANESTEDTDVQYSIVTDQDTIDYLENQEHMVVYKAMQVIDGKLYPPMSAENEFTEEYTTKKGEKKTRKVRKLKEPSQLGKWQQSDERPDLIKSFKEPSKKYPDGYGQFDLMKGTGDTSDDVKKVAYNPYEHTSNIVLNDQFSSAYRRDNLVTVEYHIPVSELTSGYKAQYAKDSVGLTDWKAGGVAQKLKNSHREVYLTRWSKPVRILDDSEVAQKYKELLENEEGISVPWNVVTPSLRTELEKVGVPIDYSDYKAGKATITFEKFLQGEYVDPKAKANRGSIQMSISTEYDSLPKPKPSLDPTSAQLQKDTRSVRDVRNDTMLKNDYSIEEVEQTNQFFDEMGEFMKKAGMTYRYIGLEDVNNAKLKITYDNDGNPQKIVLSAMVKNGDYPVNFDFTSICKKRQSISLVVKELAKRQTDGKRTLDVVNMSAESLWKINEELRKEGLETACLGCFVESKRYNIQNFSTKATNMWNSIVNEVRKEQGIEGNVEYFNFAEGTDLDSVDYTEVDRIFKDYATQPNRTSPENRMRALIRSGGAMYQKYLQPSDLMTPEGIEAIKSMSSKKNNFYGILQGVYGQASPKEVMGFSPYNSEIALLPEKKGRQQMAEYIKSIGGVRMQSFSDFLVANVYDYMQMVGDLASRRLPAHAYTKEIAFAKIFGMTGIKVNMSVMFDIDSNLPNEYAGLTFVEDENGDEEYNGVRGRFEYLVADQKRSDAEYEKTGNRPYVQSIPFDEAVALQRDARYSKNVGIIGVGYSDNHILKMLGDDDIRYVIPYHASSLPAIIKDASKIRKATDYTDSQTIRKLKSITDENGNTVDFNEFRKQFGTVAEAYGRLNELVQNEGWQVQYGGQAKSKFNLYKDIEKTNDPRKTVENYLEYCAKNNMMPVFDQFAGHENYYKLIYDFDPYDSVTGEYAPQTAVSNIYDGYNASEGELSTEAIQELIDGEMFIQNEKNRVRNEKIPSVVDSVLDQLGMKEDVQHSISDENQVAEKSIDGIYGEDIAFVDDANIAPTTAETTEEMPINSDYAPLAEEEANVRDDRQIEEHYFPDDVPTEAEEEYNGEYAPHSKPADPFYEKDIWEVGKDRKQKAYMYEHPEVKPFFQAEANYMLGELNNSTKGEKFYNDQLYYDTNGEMGWFGTTRFTSDDIAYLLDTFNYTYKDVEKGLKAIIEDNGKENNAISKRIEFLIDERLRTGYTEFMFGEKIPPNQEYINLLNSKEITQYNDESWNNWLRGLSDEDVATLSQTREDVAPTTEYIPAMIEPKGEYISIRPKQSKGEPRMARVKPSETDVAPIKEDSPIAQILTEEPAPENKNNRFWEQAMELVADKGFVFENLSKKTNNRELEAKWNYIRYADGKAQDFIGNGAEGVKALNDIQEEVTQAGLYKELSEYVYHLHNIDRMNLSNRYEDAENKPVFGDSVTADVSRSAVAELEARHPELKRYANEIYSVNNYLRGLLVEGGVISQETADLWAEMYPHYVPIRRAGDHSLHINVPLDTGRTGINAPVKKATGGSSDILPLFDTMAQRALQTYKAVAKNRFGVELKNTLGTTIGTETADVDSVIDGVEQNEELLQKGKNGRKPTFTVFEGGEKVTFEITETMYDALKPTSEALTYTNKVANKLSNFHRGVLTEYNPAFLARNIIKDVQDVLINSQHPIKTYANFPKAIKEITTKGEMYKEYVKNGGEQNSYFDKKTNTFVKDKSKFVKAVGMPLNAISEANNFIEKLPRLAEYIASREAGRSIEVSMLDSARVTTNFSAGGDLTKFANRNGATFLNASVQGAMQQVRNIREAKMNGLKGWTQLATKCAVAGLPVVLLNSLLWDDDEEYAELSNYVKQNYYIVAKYGDGKFVRIPKGRTLSVIQNALEQTMNAVTGKDEVDLQNFLQLAVSNLAPNNPIENNILAPIIQVKNNVTWYGDDLVPTRLQDLPAEEQFDESTDSISRWLGEKTGFSPYKINYLLDQYTGGVGDSVLPMLTPEAESEEDTTIGKLTAPIRSSFTTDSVLKNQNVSDFYDKKDELTTNAKGKGATDKDVLSNKYFNSVNTEIGKLYGEKRDIQSGNYTDSEKYYFVREIQRKINSLAEEALNEYDKVTIDGSYATVGGKHYKLTDDGWEKITDDQVVKMKEVMSGLGITAGEYWGNKQEYDMKYKYPEKYKVLQEQGISVEEYKENFEETAFIYTDDYSWASDNPEKYTISKVISDDVRVYKQYTSELNAIRGDDAKEKKKNYIFGLDLDDGQKALLYRSIYSSKEDKKKYNAYIVEYLNSRDDISYEEMVTILEELDFEVYSDGTVKW